MEQQYCSVLWKNKAKISIELVTPLFQKKSFQVKYRLFSCCTDLQKETHKLLSLSYSLKGVKLYKSKRKVEMTKVTTNWITPSLEIKQKLDYIVLGCIIESEL